MIRPPVRYVGGKSWLVERLKAEIEATKPKIYIEPFLGGGAIALSLDPSIKKILGDTNRPLMELWRAIRDCPENLTRELRNLEKTYDSSSPYSACINYLEVRKLFNEALGNPRLFWARRAALFLYLNARCFNGLWRVNKLGRFNVPYGKLENPRKIRPEELLDISTSLRGSDLCHHGFDETLKQLNSKRPAKGAAIYVDPPYDGVYDKYSSDGFTEDDQRKLASTLERLAAAGANVWASNADTPLVREIYGWADIETIDENHHVGSTGERRGKRGCVLIRKLARHHDEQILSPVLTSSFSISGKVAYVKSQPQTRAHHCHWPGCNAQVPPAMWGCRPHWYRLPKHLRDAIWRAYDSGQEQTMSPSGAYVDAAREVQEWIEQNG